MEKKLWTPTFIFHVNFSSNQYGNLSQLRAPASSSNDICHNSVWNASSVVTTVTVLKLCCCEKSKKFFTTLEFAWPYLKRMQWISFRHVGPTWDVCTVGEYCLKWSHLRYTWLLTKKAFFGFFQVNRYSGPMDWKKDASNETKFTSFVPYAGSSIMQTSMWVKVTLYVVLTYRAVRCSRCLILKQKTKKHFVPTQR